MGRGGPAGPASLRALQAAGRQALAGKVLIDVANPLVQDAGATTLSVCNTDSLSEQLQREFPDARMVKALNTMNNAVMVEPGRIRAPTTGSSAATTRAAPEHRRFARG